MANASNILHFSNYNTIALYMCDNERGAGGGGCKIVPLSSLGFGAHDTVKVKILQSTGLDIAKIDAKFVTDVELKPDLESFCKTIAPEEFRAKEVIKQRTDSRAPLELVDYTRECYWALTSRLRGYQLQRTYVYELPEQQLALRPIHKEEIEELLKWCMPIREYDMDAWLNTSESSTDSVVGTSENSTPSSVGVGAYLQETSDYADSSPASGASPYYVHFVGGMSAKPWPYGLIEGNRGLLIVEYLAGCNEITSHSIRTVHNSLVIDLMDAYGSTSCTIVTMKIEHAFAWDIDLQSEEGIYHSCINKYCRDGLFQGVVLMGSENGYSTYNYAKALFDNFIVPDLAD